MKVNSLLLLVVACLLAETIPIRATQITWTNSRSGNWEAVTNWSPRQVPGAGDTVTISTLMTVTLTANESVANLNCSSVTLVGTNSLVILGLAGFTNATVTLPLELANQATMFWASGDISGQITVDSGATLTMTNFSVLSLGAYNQRNHLTNSATLANNGTVIFNTEAINGYDAIIQNSGDWEDIGNGSFEASAGGTNIFVNTGLYAKSVATSTTMFETGWLFNSTGVIDTETGSLYVAAWSGTNVLNGTLNWDGGTVLSAATLEVTANSTLNWMLGDVSGALTVDIGATLTMKPGVTSLGAYNQAQHLTNNASLKNNGTVFFDAANMQGFNASIQNAGDWEDIGNESFEMSGTTNNLFVNLGFYHKSPGSGTTSFDAGWLFNSTGVINTETGSLYVAAWSGTNVLNGTLNWNGGTVLPTATLEVTTNCTMTWMSGDVSGVLTVDPGAVLTITNAPELGLYNFTSKLTNIALLENNGLILAEKETLAGYNALIQNNGEWDILTNSPFSGIAVSSLFLNTGLLVDTTSNILTFPYPWYLETTGTINTAAGSLLVVNAFYGSNVIRGSFTLTNSTVSAGVTLEIATNATVNWQQGDMNGTLMVDAGGTVNLGTSVRALSFGAQNHSLKLTNTSVVINSGTIRVTNSIVAYNASVQNSGLWETDVSVPPSGSPVSSTNFFYNLGVYQADVGSYSAFDNTWIMTNSGTINLVGGMYLRTLTQNAGATILNGGGTFLSSALFLGGTLSGVGTITGNVTNSATISPGTPVGTLNITGNFTQTGSGTMDIYLGGPSSGVDDSEIVVMGTIQTGGQLAVFLTNNFVPALEATYTFLRANGGQEIILPDFSSFLFPTNIANLSLSLDPSPFGILSLYVRMPVGPTFYNGNFVAQLMGIPGTNYTIEATSSLSPANWQKVTNVTSGIASQGLAGVIQIDDPAVSTNRFYRAVTPAY